MKTYLIPQMTSRTYEKEIDQWDKYFRSDRTTSSLLKHIDYKIVNMSDDVIILFNGLSN